jgi:HD-like signal output (HDOD) protein/CheY-like chemotaxis protein
MEAPRTVSVLFVDDDPAILRLLARMFASKNGQWQMEFAQSGAKGLELLSRAPFDVVVSDLHMPSMNGVDFLKEVREHHPLSARIIYSGHGDQQSILSCITVIHQFLPKPCPVDNLIAAIQGAAMVRSILPNPAQRQKISKMERLLSMPTVYLELVRQLKSVETPIEEIALTVSRDQAMTTQMLRIVNSAFFGLSTSNVAEAISFLGIETVRYLVLAIGIFSQFESRKLGGIAMPMFWNHSARTSHAAKLIAKTEGAGRHVIEDALAAGLLHDLGRLVLASNDPDVYQRIGEQAAEKGVEWITEERTVFGFDHAEVGGYLLGLWGLPPTVVEAVAYHHAPGKGEQTKFTALTAVHVANALVQPPRGSQGGIAPPQIDLGYLGKIGRAEALPDWVEELSASPAV